MKTQRIANPMQRYSITTPLPAIRFRSDRTEKTGVMALLPAKAIVEMRGPSDLGTGMVEVTWHCQRFAVFQRDLVTRGALVRLQAVGGETPTSEVCL